MQFSDYQPTTEGLWTQGSADTWNRLKERYEIGRRDKADVLEHWRRNLSAYEGRGRRISNDDRTSGALPSTIRAIVNLNNYQRHVRTMAAKIRAQNPTPTVLAASPSEDDVAAARSLEQLLKFIDRSNEAVSVEQLFVAYQVLYGTAFRRIAWDRNLSNTSSEEAAPEPGQPPTPEGMPFKGALVKQAIDPHNVFLPPGIQMLKHARWAIIATDLHIEEVWERWNKEVEPGLDEDLQQPVVSRMAAESSPELTTVFEYWERPNKMHPKGYYGIVSKDQTVLHEQEDLPLGEIPITCAVFSPMPGRIWGKTPMSDARTPQSLINRAATKLFEILENSAPKLVIEQGSLDKDPVPGQVFEILKKKKGSADPRVVEAQSAGQVHIQGIQLASEQMRTIVGTEAVGLGDSPGGDASGRSVLFLSAEANVSLADPVTSYRESLAATARLSLEYMKAYATEPMLYAIVDEAGREDIREMKTEDIRYQDVIYQTESGDAYSKQAMRDTATTMFQSQAIDLPTYLKMMDMPQAQTMYGADPSQRARAQSEDRALIEEWGPEDPKDWEDHGQHLGCHEAFMRSAKFYALTLQQQMKMMRHILIHHAFMGNNPFPPDFVSWAQQLIPPQPPAPGAPGAPGAPPEGEESGEQEGQPPSNNPVDTTAQSGSMPMGPAAEAAGTMPSANPAEEMAAMQQIAAGPPL